MNGQKPFTVDKSWVMSAGLHVSVAVVAYFGLPDLSREKPAPPPPIAVEFVKIGEKTMVKEPELQKEKPQEPPKEQPKPKSQTAAKSEPRKASAPAATASTAEAVPLPKPVPKVKPTPKPKKKPTVSETRKLATRVAPRSKPKAPSRIKSTKLAALIDRSIKEEKQIVKATEADKPEAEKKLAEKVDPFSGLRGRIAMASLRDALSQKLAGCWNFPGGAKGISDMSVKVRIHLRPDGSFSRTPEFVDAGDMSDGFYRTFAESARRAVVLCEPFTEAGDYIKSGRTYIDFNFSGAEFAGTD